MKRTAFFAIAILTLLTLITADRTGCFYNNTANSDAVAQTNYLIDNVDLSVPFMMGRANLAQADGKVNY